MSSSSHPDPHVPPITSMRGYVDAINELRDMVPAESRNRMFDVLTAIVDYADRQATEKARRGTADERIETLRALCDAADVAGITSGGWFTVDAVRKAASLEPVGGDES